jgi:two-component system, OmpR family, sensor kinase
VLVSARVDAASGSVGEAKLPLHLATVNLATLVDMSRARFSRLYPERELDVVADAELPHLRCDPGLLRRVVDNLLDNAAKHARNSRVALRVRTEVDVVRIEVADNGPGMSPEVAARAFDRFFRADESRDRQSGGVGLGLSIIRSIVEAHGGTVELKTARGDGTSVTAVIPRGSSVGARGRPK